MAAPTIVASGVSSAGFVFSDTTDSVTTQAGDQLFVGGTSNCFSQGTATQTDGLWSQKERVCLVSASVVVFDCSQGGTGAITVDNGTDNFGNMGWVVLRPTASEKWSSKVGEGSAAGDITATISDTGSPDLLVGYAYSPTGNISWTADSGWTKLVDEGVAASSMLQYRESTDAEWIADIAGSQTQLAMVIELVAAGGGGGSFPIFMQHYMGG